MDELTRAPERLLIDCFKALDGGATHDDLFARYPQQVDGLRPVLDMRAQLLTLKTTAPSPTTFASGREALLARVVRPLASSHPGSTETQGRQARGFNWRPATRAAFAGALLFAMTSCAIGVSATPAGDKARETLPDIPTIDVPEQRAPYPFPQNGADPQILPTEDPALAPIDENSAPIDTPPAADVPAVAPADEGDEADVEEDAAPVDADEGQSSKPVMPNNPGDLWVPPINAHEDDPPVVDTPEPPASQSDASDSDAADEKSDDDVDDTDDGPRSHDEHADDASSDDEGAISAESAE